MKKTPSSWRMPTTPNRSTCKCGASSLRTVTRTGTRRAQWRQARWRQDNRREAYGLRLGSDVDSKSSALVRASRRGAAASGVRQARVGDGASLREVVPCIWQATTLAALVSLVAADEVLWREDLRPVKSKNQLWLLHALKQVICLVPWCHAGDRANSDSSE